MLKASVGIGTYYVRLCGAIRSLKSEEGHWIFSLEESLAVVERPGYVRLLASSKVVAAVEKRWKEGDI